MATSHWPSSALWPPAIWRCLRSATYRTPKCLVEIKTAAEGFGDVWNAVIADFVERYSPGGLRFSINDGGARPDIVSLRLAQAARLMQEDDE